MCAIVSIGNDIMGMALLAVSGDSSVKIHPWIAWLNGNEPTSEKRVAVTLHHIGEVKVVRASFFVAPPLADACSQEVFNLAAYYSENKPA
jgi:hypothetical protein